MEACCAVVGNDEFFGCLSRSDDIDLIAPLADLHQVAMNEVLRLKIVNAGDPEDVLWSDNSP